MPKYSEFVEVEMVYFSDAFLELTDSQLSVAEVGLSVRIKSLHRFDA
jgi:hypothetical protein